MIQHRPLRIPAAEEQELRAQFGALCYRIKNDKIQVLLVTGRKSGFWIIPKGWPVHGETPASSAMTEAWEEAGVRGKQAGDCLGIYSHYRSDPDIIHPNLVAVFPVKVKSVEKDYPEAGQRQRKWFSVKKAAAQVDNPELAQIIEAFGRRLKAKKLQ